MTHKVAMRRKLAEGGRAAAARSRQSGLTARRRPLPRRSASRPCSSRPTRAASAESSCSSRSATSSAHLHAALAESPTGEAILEEFTDGLELNGLVIARGGEPFPADALRPAAPARRRVRRRLDPLYPSKIFGDRSRRRSAWPCGRFARWG